MRIWEKTAAKEDAGKMLEQFLREAGFSKKEISRQKFRPRGLMADGRQCRSTEIIKEGQRISLCLEDGPEEAGEPVAKGAGIGICYEDEDLLIVEKPCGIPSHPGRGHFGESALEQAQAYLWEKGRKSSLRLVGRLDKDTSGVLVFAKNQAAAARLWKQREKGIFQKTYTVLVHGVLDPLEGQISLPLEPVPGMKNRMRAAQGTGGIPARTFYKTRETYDGSPGKISLVQCTLETGRTHQIRVHMASIGHPVLGDPFYGEPDKVERLCLHAGKVKLLQPFTEKDICVEIFSPFYQLDLDYFCGRP